MEGERRGLLRHLAVVMSGLLFLLPAAWGRDARAFARGLWLCGTSWVMRWVAGRP